MHIAPTFDSLIWPWQRSSARHDMPYTVAMFRKPLSRAACKDHDRARCFDPVALVLIAFQYSRYLSRPFFALRRCRLRLCAQPRDFCCQAKDWDSAGLVFSLGFRQRFFSFTGSSQPVMDKPSPANKKMASTVGRHSVFSLACIASTHPRSTSKPQLRRRP